MKRFNFSRPRQRRAFDIDEIKKKKRKNYSEKPYFHIESNRRKEKNNELWR